MDCILFSSENAISIYAYPKWNGIIEYSYDNKEWKEWRGYCINNKIYMRGINNTIINNYFPWEIKGKNVKCQGNIENLLDYKLVINNAHPRMDTACFANMFYDCTVLIETPQLPSSILSYNCYLYMFGNCTSLITSPMFPNLQVAKEAIINQEMFDDCPIQFININNKLYDTNVLKLL